MYQYVILSVSWGGTKIKSATKVYDNNTQGKTNHTFTAQKGRAYIITIHEFHGTSNVKANYTGCEVLYSEKSLMNTTNYSTVLFASVVATGTSITITISGGIDYQRTRVYELS